MTKIEWTEKTWNPITGCSKISAGCQNCYAERMAKRLAGRGGYDRKHPFDVTFHPDRLGAPRTWKTPSMIFVCSMGDFYHELVDTNSQDCVFSVMRATPQHTYQLLTKRPEIAREALMHHPLPPNVWLGVTAENQECADKRIPILLDIPAAVRFVSVEPMLGPVDLWQWLGGERNIKPPHKYNGGIDWVICGGETGPGARKMELQWARDLRDQCRNAGVPFFFKKVGQQKQVTPADLLVREWPQ